MPIVIDYSTDRFYLQGLKTQKKEDIKELLLSGKLTMQEIAIIMKVSLELVQEIETSLKK
jgi:DNA-binding CsgD family transcriptional regulator